MDVSYFDTAFTEEPVKLTPMDRNLLEELNQAQFKGFSYTNAVYTKWLRLSVFEPGLCSLVSDSSGLLSQKVVMFVGQIVAWYLLQFVPVGVGTLEIVSQCLTVTVSELSKIIIFFIFQDDFHLYSIVESAECQLRIIVKSSSGFSSSPNLRSTLQISFKS